MSKEYLIKNSDKLLRQLKVTYSCDVAVMSTVTGDVDLYYPNELSALRVAWKLRNKADSVVFCPEMDNKWKIHIPNYYKVL